jgi:hypothetical protein
MPLTQAQLTEHVVMVRPVDFGFNEQTGLDNDFQTRPSKNNAEQVTTQALIEFERCVNTLQDKGVEVEVLEKSTNQSKVPDAVFPNNWFSTRCNGDLIIYPMKTANRQAEIQVELLSEQLISSGFKINKLIDLRQQFGQQQPLEGTGSLIFHHPSQQLFAAISERCLANPLTRFAEEFEYQLTAFKTATSKGKPVYHTNVLMSCGENFSVVTESVILPSDRKITLDTLSNTVDDIIIISEQQMAENFCGNILQLSNKNNDPVIVMSHSAYRGFTAHQKKILERHGEFAIFEIPTIETIGGGSARCMIAENFLVKG